LLRIIFNIRSKIHVDEIGIPVAHFPGMEGWFSCETNICFRCGTQVIGCGIAHVTGFGTTALKAAPPVSVGTPDVKSTCGVGFSVLLLTSDFPGISGSKLSRSA